MGRLIRKNTSICLVRHPIYLKKGGPVYSFGNAIMPQCSYIGPINKMAPLRFCHLWWYQYLARPMDKILDVPKIWQNERLQPKQMTMITNTLDMMIITK
jgi:hypothetical protein